MQLSQARPRTEAKVLKERDDGGSAERGVGGEGEAAKGGSGGGEGGAEEGGEGGRGEGEVVSAQVELGDGRGVGRGAETVESE